MSIAKRAAQQVLGHFGLELRRQRPAKPYPEVTDFERDEMDAVAPYTMVTRYRQWSLIKAVDYIDRANIPGDIVECGVWRGGLVMLMKQHRKASPIRRKYFLYDTFEGLPPPTKSDGHFDGRTAAKTYASRTKAAPDGWCAASLSEVQSNFQEHGLLDQSVVFVKGKVEDTLRDPANVPGQIALLRLDTDWYESTRAELDTLYPRLAVGGVIIMDDYGQWTGAKKAFDEYFADKALLMSPIDYACRMGVKTAAI